MFRQLRNQSKRIDQSDAERILLTQRYGILSTTNEDGFPYSSPSMFVYKDGRIYFHCAAQGQKRENLLRDPRVCFCVVEERSSDSVTEPIVYRSVITFGNIRFVEAAEDRLRVYTALCEKYNMMEKVEDPDYIKKRESCTEVLCMNVEHVTGKKL